MAYVQPGKAKQLGQILQIVLFLCHRILNRNLKKSGDKHSDYKNCLFYLDKSNAGVLAHLAVYRKGKEPYLSV